MANIQLLAGIALILFGATAVSGVLGFSTASTNLSSLSVACDPSDSNCVASLSIGNVNAVSPLTVYFIATSQSTGTTDAWASVQASISAGASATVNGTIPGQLPSGSCPTSISTSGGCLVPGTPYVLSAYIIDAAGSVASPTVTANFNSNGRLVVFYESPVSSVSVSSAGYYVAKCTSSCSSSFFTYSAYYPWGTQVSVTPTIIGGSACWEQTSSTSSTCTTISSGQSFSVTVGSRFYGNYEPVWVTELPVGSTVRTMLVNTNIAGVMFTPAPPYYFAASTFSSGGVQYTASPVTVQMSNPNGGITWRIPGTPFKGTNSSLVISWAKLLPYATFGAGDQAQFSLKTYADPQLTISAAAGATTIPKAGTYTYSPGQKVNVSVTVASGYSFQGWIVGGENKGTNSSISLTMPDWGATTLYAQTFYGGGGGGSGGGGGNSTCTLNPSTNAGVNVLILNSTGGPVSAVAVSGAGASGVTDKTGHALLCNITVPGGTLGLNTQGTVSITASKSGYSSASQDVTVAQGVVGSATIEIQSNGFGHVTLGQVIGGGALIAGGVLAVSSTRKKKAVA